MRNAVLDSGSQPIRNESTDPRAIVSTGATPGQYTIDATRYNSDSVNALVSGIVGPAGTDITTAIRRTQKADGTSSGRGFALTAGNPETGTVSLAQGVPVTPGEVRTVSIYVRCTSAQNWNIRVRFGAAGTTDWAGATVSSGGFPQVAGTWRRAVAQFTVPAGADRMVAMVTMFSNTLTAGDAYEATGLMVVAGRYDGVYCDGYTPGWQFDGTPGVSSSVGYPYTLASILGAPAVTSDSTFPVDIPLAAADQKTSGYTFYSVTTPVSGARATLLDGISTTQRIHITYNDGAQRWNLHQSASVFGPTIADSGIRKVMAGRFDQSNSKLFRNGVVHASGNAGQASTPATALRIGRNAAGNDPWLGTIEVVYLYSQPHTDAQIVQASNWLALRYSVET